MHSPRRAAASITLAALLTAGGACAAGAPASASDRGTAISTVSAATAATKSAVRTWAAKQYGTFTTRRLSGTGDDVLTVPASVRAAVVTASHDGESNFAIQALNKKNKLVDLLVNEIGTYHGTTAFGLDERSTVRHLQVTADGDWTITIRAVAQAGALSSSGDGDAVRLFNKPTGALRLTHKGESNFAVLQHKGGRYNYDLLVNEIGNYKGTVPTAGGPSVLEIKADGHWTTKSK